MTEQDQQFESIKDLLYASDEASVSLGLLQLERAAKECDKCKELRDGLIGLWMELREREYDDDGDIWSLHDMLMLDEISLCVDEPWDGGKIALLQKTKVIMLYYGHGSLMRFFNNSYTMNVQLHNWIVNPWALIDMKSLKRINLPDGYGPSRAHDQLVKIMPKGFAIDALPF